MSMKMSSVGDDFVFVSLGQGFNFVLENLDLAAVPHTLFAESDLVQSGELETSF